MKKTFSVDEYYDPFEISRHIKDLELIKRIRDKGDPRCVELYYSQTLGKYLEKGPFCHNEAICYHILDIKNVEEWDTTGYED